ncbi:MAG: BatA domain-containing protein, partial [Bacteroidetes bacterium]|nr:BatA domain-containing protein [Bacteroidota bacterium]
MQFVYPGFLFALFAISIPIIIHLFNFRRYKKIVFSDIRFLKQVIEKNQKQQNIKNWLVLLCRILAISFLVIAFAQPYLPF